MLALDIFVLAFLLAGLAVAIATGIGRRRAWGPVAALVLVALVVFVAGYRVVNGGSVFGLLRDEGEAGPSAEVSELDLRLAWLMFDALSPYLNGESRFVIVDVEGRGPATDASPAVVRASWEQGLHDQMGAEATVVEFQTEATINEFFSLLASTSGSSDAVIVLGGDPFAAIPARYQQSSMPKLLAGRVVGIVFDRPPPPQYVRAVLIRGYVKAVIVQQAEGVYELYTAQELQR